MASNKVSCKKKALIDPELQIKKKVVEKNKQSAYVFFVFIIIFETYILCFFKEEHSCDIVKRVNFTMKPFFLNVLLCMCVG